MKKIPLKCVIVVLLLPVFIYVYFFYAAYRFDEFITYSRYSIHNTNRTNYQQQSRKCEVIHLGVVATTTSASLHFYTLLKSILLHRNNPLHFHVMVSNVTEKSLRTLFGTWDVPQVNVSFYDLNTNITAYWWKLKDQPLHPQVVSSLLKLTIVKIVPANVTSKLIVLDPEIFFGGDVINTWQIFDSFNKKQAIGVFKYPSNRSREADNQQLNPENQEVQKKYQFAIVLYNLQRLQKIAQAEKLLRSTNNAIADFRGDNVTAEDVANQLFDQHGNLMCQIPRYWSRLRGESTSISTYQDDSDEGLYRTIVQYDGSALRNRIFECKAKLKPDTIESNNDNCSDYHIVETHQWRTLTHIREFKYNATKHDVTFVSQLSYSRRSLLEELSTVWEGPFSVAIYLTDAELNQFIDFVENSKFLKKRFDIAYHAVFNDVTIHPINVLRNVALRNVVTPYVFLVDIDFIPMPKLYTILKQHIANIKDMGKRALIVPAFETKQHVPKLKSEVLKMLDSGALLQFHYRYRQAHLPTNYTRWRTANSTYEVQWKKEFEPYIVVQSNVTEYDPRFIGYGWNKVSHIMELKVQGYEFLVLPDAFIVHKPHKASSDKRKFMFSKFPQRCLLKLRYKFIREIYKKYNKKRSKKTKRTKKT